MKILDRFFALNKLPQNFQRSDYNGFPIPSTLSHAPAVFVGIGKPQNREYRLNRILYHTIIRGLT
jgi:hypothetical protein